MLSVNINNVHSRLNLKSWVLLVISVPRRFVTADFFSIFTFFHDICTPAFSVWCHATVTSSHYCFVRFIFRLELSPSLSFPRFFRAFSLRSVVPPVMAKKELWTKSKKERKHKKREKRQNTQTKNTWGKKYHSAEQIQRLARVSSCASVFLPSTKAWRSAFSFHFLLYSLAVVPFHFLGILSLLRSFWAEQLQFVYEHVKTSLFSNTLLWIDFAFPISLRSSLTFTFLSSIFFLVMSFAFLCFSVPLPFCRSWCERLTVRSCESSNKN